MLSSNESQWAAFLSKNLKVITEAARYVAQRYSMQASEADDIAQSFVLTCLERSKVAPPPARLVSPNTWFRRRLKNIAIDKLRKDISRREKLRRDYPIFARRLDSDELPIHVRDELEIAIQLLPKAERTFLTEQLNGETIHNIAIKYNVTENAVKSRLYRARKDLRAYFR
jgi:RNA polymerase sigma factor (sigma-70 family)